MTSHDDFDRTLAGWFETDAASPPPTGDLERVIDATRRREPRPGWLSGLGSDWVGEAPIAQSSARAPSLWRLGLLRWPTALVFLLVLAALVGAAILAGGLPSRLSSVPTNHVAQVPPPTDLLGHSSPVPTAGLVRPSPLPAGRLGHLAYGLDGSIYVADWNGKNPVQIAHGVFDQGGAGPAGCGSFWGEGPMWAPDGLHLAYRGAWDAGCPGASGADNVYLADPGGKVVAAFPGTGWLVSWSPDSTRVAVTQVNQFASDARSVELGQTFGIYGLDGVRQALLAVPLGYVVHGDYSPVWSPDGLSLLMKIAAGNTPSEVWEFPIDGGTPQRVPNEDPRSHSTVAYSLDGSRLAYIASPSLVIAKADGTELRVLPVPVNGFNGHGEGVASDPVVSPTGDRVAFTWSRANYFQSPDPSSSADELRVVDVASGTMTTLATGRSNGPCAAIKFSPLGDKILCSRSDANGTGTSLWSVDADGSGAQLLVTGTGWGDWQWQPAGS